MSTSGVTDVASRIAAIQQMAAALNGGNATAGAGFDQALSSAQSADGTSSASSTSATGGAVNGMPYASEITAAATKYGIEPALLAGLVKQESGFNPNAKSGAGAQGLTQLMPATAKSMGVTNINDPAQQLDAGAKYLKAQLDKFGGDASLALAAYNAGPGAVTRYGGVPPYSETQNYVKNVLANRDAYRATAATSSGSIGSTTNTAAALSALGQTTSAATTGGTSAIQSSLSALSTDDDSSNLSLSTSSTSTGGSASSSLGYPTT